MVAPDLREFVFGGLRLQPGELPLHQVRPSVRLLWGEVLQAVTVVAVTLAVPYGFQAAGLPPPEFLSSGWGPPAVGAGAVAVELFYLVPRIGVAWIHVAFTEYTLTTDRIYVRTEFITADLKTVPYEKVSLVRIRRGLFQRLLGVTEVSVRAYGAEEGHVRLRGLVDPVAAFQTCRDQIRVHNTAASLVRSD